VRLSPLGIAANVWLIVPAQDDDDESGAISKMRTGRGNRSTWRKPAPVSLCPPQILHDLTWARTQAAAVGSWRLTASAMTRPIMSFSTEDSCVVHWLTLHAWSLISTDWLRGHLFAVSLAEPLSDQLTVGMIVFKITHRHGDHGKRFVVKNACLLGRYLAMDVREPHRKPLLRHWFYCYVRVFRALLINWSTCHNKFYSTPSWSTHTVYAKSILRYTTIWPWSCVVDTKQWHCNGQETLSLV
jgi:hypothetical protein